jgi:hypothetical protein
MSKLIKPLPGLPGIPSIKKLTRLRPAKLPIDVDIVKEPEVPGASVNMLEEAAVSPGLGTLPERIIWKWLEDNKMIFRVQYAEFGGRGQLGGVALDFVVYGMAAAPVALRVQGGYWHGPASDRKAQDDESAGRLRMAGYLVVDLWEQDIYTAVRTDRLREYIMWRVI